MISSFLPDWTIRVTLFPPLATEGSNLSDATRAESIMHHYAAFLEETWRQMPETVDWETISRHLEKPEVSHV